MNEKQINRDEEMKNEDFEIEILSEPFQDVAIPVPGGCNSSCSNDVAV